MNLVEIFEELLCEVESNISGELTLEGSIIKWSYNCFSFNGHDEDDLEVICEEDFEIIDEFFEENNIEIYKTVPEIIDTTIFVDIEI
jgi:hypothetical protein